MRIKKYEDDIYTCNRTRCGYCREPACVVYKEMGFESYSSRGRMLIARGLLEGVLEPSRELLDCINLCATCGYCASKCALHNVEITESLRADLVDAGFKDEYHNRAVEEIKRNNNPYLKPRNERANWAKDVNFSKSADTLLYVGCTYPYLFPDWLKSSANLLIESGLKLNYLGNEEGCCGNLMLTTGFLQDFIENGEKNVEIFRKAGIKRIITGCPGCYKIFAEAYPEYFNFDIEIEHITQSIAKLLDEGKIKPTKSIKSIVTYHDPCHLSRHMKVLEEPRKILRSIPGLELREMEHNKFDAKCCGAGGGMMAAYPEVAVKIAEKRVREAEATGAEILVTTCPICEFNFERAIRYSDSKIKLVDLMELLKKSI
ncbi:MAG: (Fe-S)-binding protein [Candidatus Jordarchaeaceae archaeon]